MNNAWTLQYDGHTVRIASPYGQEYVLTPYVASRAVCHTQPRKRAVFYPIQDEETGLVLELVRYADGTRLNALLAAGDDPGLYVPDAFAEALYTFLTAEAMASAEAHG